ncbi:MAG: hypothetical protein WDZ70_02480 [Candidatus Paceibacterota bacterium]
MILFKLFSLHSRGEVMKKWLEDPAGEARGYVHDLIVGYITSAALVAIIVLGGLALLGFGSILGGPHQAARVLFYVACVFMVIVSLALWLLLRKVHTYTQKFEDAYRRSTAREAEYEEGRDTIYLHNGEKDTDN